MVSIRLEYLKKMDRIVAEAGPGSARRAIDSLGYEFIAPGHRVRGFIMMPKGTVCYGVNRDLPGRMQEFGIFHEGFHGICGHILLPDFLTGSLPLHVDRFESLSAQKVIASTELDANIGAADFVCDTQAVLEMLGYYREDVRSYREDVRTFEAHAQEYARTFAEHTLDAREHREELGRMSRSLQEQAQELMNSGACLSKNEIARQEDVPAYVIDLKIAALNIRGYRIGEVELPAYDKVFRCWS